MTLDELNSAVATATGKPKGDAAKAVTAVLQGIQDALSKGDKVSIAGFGVFARDAITKNTRIVSYEGERISHRESQRREARQLPLGFIWCFTVDERTVVDASVGGNIARFVNHSCHPNCYVQIAGGVIWIRAARNIRKGEELTYDYMTDGEGQIRCRCSRECQRLL